MVSYDFNNALKEFSSENMMSCFEVKEETGVDRNRQSFQFMSMQFQKEVRRIHHKLEIFIAGSLLGGKMSKRKNLQHSNN